MNYQIIHDRPGRVRVRFGPNSFNREEGYGIAALLTQKADAIQAETFPINGSVLIYYPKSGRRKILMTLDHICTLPTLPKGKPDDSVKLREASNEFQDQLIAHVGRHFLR